MNHSSTSEPMLELERLRAENARLRSLLESHGIEVLGAVGKISSSESPVAPVILKVSKRSPLEDRIALFMSLFQGRQDVCARRWESRNGRAGYSPACKNEWRKGVCLKPKGKCAECAYAA